MEAAPACCIFAPEDEVAVEYYLLPRILGWSPRIGGLVLEDDPLSAPPWELLGRNGRKEEAFFLAEGQTMCGKGSRQKRTCAGGGWWEGQKTCAEGDKVPVPCGGGQEAAWRKKALNFHDGGGKKGGSTGWVMHEYSVTAPEDLARSPLRLYHIRRSSYARKQIAAMEVPRALGLPPGFLFAPEDGDVVAHYLLRRVLGQPLPMDGLILDDNPLSAPPWELLERNGRKDDAFFFALGQARSTKGSRQKRTCVGGGFWNGERTCVDGEKLCVPGPGGVEVTWRKKALSFQEGGEKGSTGWVMHEYAITAPEHLAESQLRLYRIRFSGHGKKRKRADHEDSCADGSAPTAVRRRVAEDALLDISTSQPICASSSTLTVDHADGNCSSDAGQQAAPVTISANQDLTPGITADDSLDWSFLDSFDIDAFMSSLPDDLTSTDPCVLPDPSAYPDAHAGGSSSSSLAAMASPPSAYPSSAPAMYRGCMEPADSFFTVSNLSYAAC